MSPDEFHLVTPKLHFTEQAVEDRSIYLMTFPYWLRLSTHDVYHKTKIQIQLLTLLCKVVSATTLDHLSLGVSPKCWI